MEDLLWPPLSTNTSCSEDKQIVKGMTVEGNEHSEGNWSGSTLFAIQYVNLYQQPGSSNLIGWKLEVGVAS